MKRNISKETHPSSVKVPITDIVRAEIAQIRPEGLSETKVREYMSKYRSGTDLGPVNVARLDGSLLLEDGYHRVEALVRIGRTDVIEAFIFDRANIHEVRFHGGMANCLHGLPLSNKGKLNLFREYVKTKRCFTATKEGKRVRKSWRAMSKDLQGNVSFMGVKKWVRNLKEFRLLKAMPSENPLDDLSHTKRKENDLIITVDTNNHLETALVGFKIALRALKDAKRHPSRNVQATLAWAETDLKPAIEMLEEAQNSFEHTASQEASHCDF